ncbi:ATP-grasp fold amidoligase family protein [Rhizobium sp. AAP43]|uniref:ATP-grasp fold amidoligase family protein n=1 Tax=Rhizobium sp. AAP43 TaxID=1523420 RepID=UPI0006B8A2F8|nr:ATP-grasp fold amidoligase family protein [Rhizobium sp. AAP43]KPF46131.1 polysaccharide biosynthesis protein [Rhizobium sp. AAP43]
MSEPRKESFIRSGYEQSSLLSLMKRIFWRLIAPLPDRPYVALKFWSMKGAWPRLDAPRTFSEKVQYRKLHDRNPLYGKLVDKLAVKEFIAGRIGAQHVIPTYWAGTNLRDADWSKIPLPAVMKPNHASGLGRFLYTQADVDALVIDDPGPAWLATDHARYNREWAYSQVERKIVVEKLLSKDGGVPWDYRCFVFNGVVSYVIVDTRVDDRGYSATYSRSWERLPFYDPDYYAPYPGELPKPDTLDLMVSLAERLVHDLDFVRVDFFDTDEGLFVGELTLYPGGGFEAFEPPEYDLILGNAWQLPPKLP